MPGALLWEWEHCQHFSVRPAHVRVLCSFLERGKALNVQAVDPGKEVYMPLKYRYELNLNHKFYISVFFTYSQDSTSK